jgi:hypothetical protein
VTSEIGPGELAVAETWKVFGSYDPATGERIAMEAVVLPASPSPASPLPASPASLTLELSRRQIPPVPQDSPALQSAFEAQTPASLGVQASAAAHKAIDKRFNRKEPHSQEA